MGQIQTNSNIQSTAESHSVHLSTAREVLCWCSVFERRSCVLTPARTPCFSTPHGWTAATPSSTLTHLTLLFVSLRLLAISASAILLPLLTSFTLPPSAACTSQELFLASQALSAVWGLAGLILSCIGYPLFGFTHTHTEKHTHTHTHTLKTVTRDIGTHVHPRNQWLFSVSWWLSCSQGPSHCRALVQGYMNGGRRYLAADWDGSRTAAGRFWIVCNAAEPCSQWQKDYYCYSRWSVACGGCLSAAVTHPPHQTEGHVPDSRIIRSALLWRGGSTLRSERLPRFCLLSDAGWNPVSHLRQPLRLRPLFCHCFSDKLRVITLIIETVFQ